MTTDRSARSRSPDPPVSLVPWSRCLALLLVALVPWLLVVVGRAVCLVAQRLPPVVRLVRRLRRWSGDRRVLLDRRAPAAAVRPSCPGQDLLADAGRPVAPQRRRTPASRPSRLRPDRRTRRSPAVR